MSEGFVCSEVSFPSWLILEGLERSERERERPLCNLTHNGLSPFLSLSLSSRRTVCSDDSSDRFYFFYLAC